MPVDPATQALLDFVDQAGYPPMHEGTPEDARKGFRAMTCDAGQPDQVVAVESVEETEVAGMAARVYRPARPDGGTGPLPTVLHLHGGGFVIGDLDTHDQTCRRLANDAQAVVVAVDYRLAPEHPFPAAVDDAVAAAEWVSAHLGELGGSDVLGVAGDSAGGNLAAVVAQALPGRVAAQLLTYPAVDMFGSYQSRVDNREGYFLDMPTMEWFAGRYLEGVADVQADDPRHSPLHGALEGQPPAVVATAEYDPLRDEGEAYAAALAGAGTEVDVVRYDGLVHGFVDMGLWSPAAADAVADMNRRFRALLHR
ncbi:alpha/beta hydrolase [Nocardioides perillae]|uniref:Acetyl esterase n=1 Tax=Nocardioides perillae TaxID=1119534 RepID=A0A7Y9RQM2_9ACTN|nr:alpha/beta hydrolase [Nocardioides perillae]NYG54741.1 acetyl esterase [Nocardioides perillae]